MGAYGIPFRFPRFLCYYAFMKKKIVVGFDFDGVVAYNPARIVRLPISYFKEHLLGNTSVSFFVPKTPMTRLLWALAHESSVFPAMGASLLRDLVRQGDIEAHLVTGRFGFLEENLLRFLRRWDLERVFTSVTLNTKEEQPHLFKERVIREKKFDYYVEDNWDIVQYLSRKHLGTTVHWIYNVFDRGKAYPDKYPYVRKSLERIAALNNINPDRIGVKA